MFEKGIKVALIFSILAVLGIALTAGLCFLGGFGVKSVLDIAPDILEISIYLGLGGAAIAFLSIFALFFQKSVSV